MISKTKWVLVICFLKQYVITTELHKYLFYEKSITRYENVLVIHQNPIST